MLMAKSASFRASSTSIYYAVSLLSLPAKLEARTPTIYKSHKAFYRNSSLEMYILGAVYMNFKETVSN